jgi:C4-dicarboxylate-binding protein DctP
MPRTAAPLARRLLLAAALVLPLAAQAEAPIVIKFSHVVAADTPKGRAAQRFKEEAEKRTNGRVKVEIYPNSQLYKDKEELEALQLGSVQMLAPSLSKFGPMGAKQFEIFDLPYLFTTEQQFVQLTNGKIGAELLTSLESKGIRGLAFWSGGFHVFSANKPLLKPADLKGLKMRIPSSKVLDASLRLMGALPQTLPFSEVYQALQTGVVDGTENILSSYTSQKYYEVQKHITLTNHTHTGYAVVVNKKFWDGLPPDIQAALAESIKQASDYELHLVAQENQDALAELRKNSRVQVHDLTDAEREQWRTTLLPVHKEMESRIGGGLLSRVYQANAAVK